jgi:hypothetical protein
MKPLYVAQMVLCPKSNNQVHIELSCAKCKYFFGFESGTCFLNCGYELPSKTEVKK